MYVLRFSVFLCVHNYIDFLQRHVFNVDVVIQMVVSSQTRFKAEFGDAGHDDNRKGLKPGQVLNSVLSVESV